MNYKEHTRQRFEEKFIPIIKGKKKKFWEHITSSYWLEFTDGDYNNLCEVSLNDPLYREPTKNRVLVKYKNIFMWCVLSKKSKIVKTIYPIDRSDFRKYLNCV